MFLGALTFDIIKIKCDQELNDCDRSVMVPAWLGFISSDKGLIISESNSLENSYNNMQHLVMILDIG